MKKPIGFKLSLIGTDFIKTETLIETSPTQIYPTKGQQSAFKMFAAHQEHQSQLPVENILSSELTTIQDEKNDVIMII